jgi:hypothetical protein
MSGIGPLPPHPLCRVSERCGRLENLPSVGGTTQSCLEHFPEKWTPVFPAENAITLEELVQVPEKWIPVFRKGHLDVARWIPGRPFGPPGMTACRIRTPRGRLTEFLRWIIFRAPRPNRGRARGRSSAGTAAAGSGDALLIASGLAPGHRRLVGAVAAMRTRNPRAAAQAAGSRCAMPRIQGTRRPMPAGAPCSKASAGFQERR